MDQEGQTSDDTNTNIESVGTESKATVGKVHFYGLDAFERNIMLNPAIKAKNH